MGQLDLFFLVGLTGGEEDDEEGEEERDEVGVGDEPALVVYVLGMFFLALTPCSYSGLACALDSDGLESKR